ncbi:MAG: benzoate-CoA ligase family protein [Hyphomicrobiales bacterium]|nr:benzoate-CoA ligase family protein [Hyphomicrobiales bacterium]
MSVRDYNAAVDFVDRHVAEGRAAKAAFIDPARNLTYGELSESAARVGPMLARLGVEQENRIALILLDTVDFPILFWGAVRAGVAPVLMNTRLTVDQYRYLLADSRAKVAFVSPALLPTIEEAAAGLPSLREIVVVGGGMPDRPRFETLLSAEREGAAPAQTCADDIAYWLYSSGTTGMPKGVMHVHGAPRVMAESAGLQRIGYRETDVVFSAAKLFFAYGVGSALICPNWVGATTILYPERPTPRTVFEMLRAFNPTMFFAVPSLYATILADPECRPEAASKNWRLCFAAGEPLPAHIGEAWKQRFGLDIVNGVGSSEAGHLFLTNTPGAVDYLTSGTPLRGFDLELRDEAGRSVADGESGELWVRSDTIAAGYWNQLEKTRRNFVGGWLRTGDKYVRRPDGAFVFQGRADDMFKVSGIWVSPFEIEDALTRHPRVVEAAVVPAEDSDGLVKPKAFVVLDHRRTDEDRALFEELKSLVKNAIGPWKYPRWIEYVDELPKTASGKIQRYLLRET